jgi:hypothetical protein
MLRPVQALLILSVLCAAPWRSGAQKESTPPAGVKARLPEAPECRIRLQFGLVVTQNVTVKPDRIVGADYNLHVEDQIVYGFISGQPTRMKLKDKHISGSAAGRELMLNVKNTETTTEVSGLVGGVRVSAVVSEHRVRVNAMRGALYLTRDRGNHLSGQMGLSSDIAPAHLTTYGCELSEIRKRPDLIVVLFMWWLGG